MMWSFANAFPLLTSSEALEFEPAQEPATVERAAEAMTDLLDHVAQFARLPLIEVLPGLHNFRATVVDRSVFATRAANTLDRLGISTWGELGACSLESMGLLPNVGPTTVDEIARQTILQSLRDPIANANANAPADDEKQGLQAPCTSESDLIAFARQLALWAQLETDDAATIGDVLGVTRSLPVDLKREWTHLSHLKWSSFHAPTSTLRDLVDLLVADFDPTWQAILHDRVLAAEPMTLRELGDRIGLTRERIRQIQVKVEENLRHRLNLVTFAPLQWRAESLRQALGSTAPANDPVAMRLLEAAVESVDDSRRVFVQAFLLYAAGPYELRDGWLSLRDVELPAPADLFGLVDADGLIDRRKASEWLDERGISHAFADRWLQDKAKAVIVDDDHVIPRWTSVVDHCVARLALRGSPATAEDLIREIGEGHSAKGVRNRLFDDERVVRVNKTQWGLRRWDLEEYTGIADEILQRIEVHGGRVKLDWLVPELVGLFNVAEGSVRAYASAPMFVVEDGYVRRRRSDEAFEVSGDISGCRGVFGGGPNTLSLVVSVDRDVLRGSGRSLPPPVAARLGVAPGRSRAFTHPGGEVQVTWPETAALGPSLGSTRSAVSSVGASVGERVRLTFDAASETVAAERVLNVTSAAPADALFMLTGLRVHGDAHSAVADAIGTSPTNVRRALAARGDHEVLGLLGSPPADPSLEAALADLAGALGEIE